MTDLRGRIIGLFSLSLLTKFAIAAGVGIGGIIIQSGIDRRADDTAGERVDTLKRTAGLSADGDTGIDGDELKLFSEIAKLVAPDGTQNDEFGFSVAINGDTAIVGASSDDGDRGAAYVYIRTGSGWSFQQRLTASDGLAEDSFGWSVAISGDTAAIGAFADDAAAVDQGSIYVFRRSGAIWAQEQQITAADAAAGDQLGISVAIDGTTIVAGAYGDDSSRGSTYVFTRAGSAWSLQQKLVAGDGVAGDAFGTSLAISGESVIVGADQDDAGRGAAYVFIRTGSAWTQQQKLSGADGLSLDAFGHSVAIDGNTALIGAVNDEIATNGMRGSAYLFDRSGAAWTQTFKFVSPTGVTNNNFGASVAVSGNRFFIGAHGDDLSPNGDQGTVYIHSRNGSLLFVEPNLNASDRAANDNFGGSVAVAGNTLIVGAYLDDNGAALNQGSTYIFTDASQATPSPTVTPTQTPTPALTPTPTPTPTGTASISGRVLAPDGRGLRSTVVSIGITGQLASRFVTTNSFGYYVIENVTTGPSYSIGVRSRRYKFPTKIFTLTGNLADIDFSATE